jgi:hypothetical protein
MMMRGELKTIGKRVQRHPDLASADVFLKMVIELRGDKPFIPRGVHRFASVEESESWSLRMMARTRMIYSDHCQIEALQKMTPTQKWKASMNIYWSARSLKMAFLRREHPGWTEEMLCDEVNRLFALGHG